MERKRSCAKNSRRKRRRAARQEHQRDGQRQLLVKLHAPARFRQSSKPCARRRPSARRRIAAIKKQAAQREKERKAHRQASSCEKTPVHSCCRSWPSSARPWKPRVAGRWQTRSTNTHKASTARVSVGSFRSHACAYARSARQNGPRPARRGKDMLQRNWSSGGGELQQRLQ